MLNVADGDALLAAIQQIRTNVARTPAEHPRAARAGAADGRAASARRWSAIASIRDVGPLVMVAAGGILTEIYRDRSLRLAPVDLAIAQEMIAEVRGLAALAGFRGRPKGDLDALARGDRGDVAARRRAVRSSRPRSIR